MNDETNTPAEPDTDPDAPEHPMQRAHKFFQKAVPAIREVSDAIEGGALEQVRDTVVERATQLVQRVDNVVANVTAIEGDIIERIVDEPAAAADGTGNPGAASQLRHAATHSTKAQWITIGVIAAAATYGALKLQRRS